MQAFPAHLYASGLSGARDIACLASLKPFRFPGLEKPDANQLLYLLHLYS